MSSTIRLTRISWGLLMNSFCEHHKGSIRWQYRCFDRILLNSLIQPFSRNASSASSRVSYHWGLAAMANSATS